MNAKRRKLIETIIDILEQQRDEIDYVASDEQEAFDNMPEGLQYSERGDTMQENIDDLESASSDLDDIISNLNDILDR
jgi:hypothetical protein